MVAKVARLKLIENTDNPEIKALNKKANNLFKIGVGTSIFSAGAASVSTLLDITNIAKLPIKFDAACGLGVFGGLAMMLASTYMTMKVEKKAIELSEKENEVGKNIDENS